MASFEYWSYMGSQGNGKEDGHYYLGFRIKAVGSRVFLRVLCSDAGDCNIYITPIHHIPLSPSKFRSYVSTLTQYPTPNSEPNLKP